MLLVGFYNFYIFIFQGTKKIIEMILYGHPNGIKR